jgi:ABC-2 type transport system ATP-binding protein
VPGRRPAPSPDRAAIWTRGLTRRYGDLVAVDHLDLTVRPGEIFGLLGPNGAGKTTTILMLLGLTEPTEGEARVLGLDPTRHPLEVKRRVGYVPDSVGFYESMTGRENLRYTARLNGIDPREAERRIDEVLERVGLRADADRRVREYSRGMLQRLGIADVLLKDPEVFILDEPTTAIDPEGVAEVLDLIRSLAREGAAVLLSSHLLHQVQAVCDRVGIFVRGRMVAQGPMSELARKLATGPVTVEVGTADGGVDVEAALRAVPGVREVRREERDSGLWVLTADRDVRTEVARALTQAGAPPSHLRRRGGELDEIYRRYFQEAERGDGR